MLIVPSADDLLLAKFDKDGQWYRAKVLNLLSNRQAEILFIDYGNTANVPTKQWVFVLYAIVMGFLNCH